jgi:hypothetical protein
MDAMTLRLLTRLFDAYDAATRMRDGDLDEWLLAIERAVECEQRLAVALGLEVRR